MAVFAGEAAAQAFIRPGNDFQFGRKLTELAVFLFPAVAMQAPASLPDGLLGGKSLFLVFQFETGLRVCPGRKFRPFSLRYIA